MANTLPKFDGAIAGRHLGWNPTPAAMKRKTLPLAPFLKRMGAKPPPDAVDYTNKGKRSLATMLGNDQAGDCTIAACLHQGAVMTAEEPGGAERVPATNEALSQYERVCGPGDNGCYIPVVMDWWRDKGLQVGGKVVRADGYVSLALGDELLAKTACFLFGPLHFGINLPNDWYQNAREGFVWDTTGSRIVGGHSIAIPGYDTNGFKVSTWGAVGTMTFRAFHSPQWVEEIYATLSPDWYDDKGLDTHGLNVTALKDALEAIKRGGTPDIPDVPTPVPPTPPGPNPPAPGAHEISHTFHVFGYALRVYAGYDLSQVGMMDTSANTWKLLQDAWALYRAIASKDMTAIFAAVTSLLEDLGINLPFARVDALARYLQAREQTKVLDGPYPPNSVDNYPQRR